MAQSDGKQCIRVGGIQRISIITALPLPASPHPAPVLHLHLSLKMAKYFTTLLLTIASLQAATASPLNARAEVAEVIPGEGLPSLQSLGLTSEKLYAMGLPPSCMHSYSHHVSPSIALY
jgi:hypothetical protein